MISKEYSTEWKPGDEPFYPVNDEKNNKLLGRYQDKAKETPDVIFGSRLGEYKYYDMDEVIAQTLKICRKEWDSQD